MHSTKENVRRYLSMENFTARLFSSPKWPESFCSGMNWTVTASTALTNISQQLTHILLTPNLSSLPVRGNARLMETALKQLMKYNQNIEVVSPRKPDLLYTNLRGFIKCADWWGAQGILQTLRWFIWQNFRENTCLYLRLEICFVGFFFP